MTSNTLADRNAADPNIETAVVSRLMWRLLPFLFLLYIVAYLDRINVSFAILQMRTQLHLSDKAYGGAAGMFFAGYLLFQIPSNIVLEKVGVRRWIAILMIAWGLVSCLMIFIRGPQSFYAFRFLLGAAEAGFFPGIILYLKRWFPAGARARAVAWFMAANPLAGVVGSPISGALLGLHAMGLAGWQWLFVMEGLPAMLLGVAVLWILQEWPREATWLTNEQRGWLLRELEWQQVQDQIVGEAFKKPARMLWGVLTSGSVWLLSITYFGVSTCMYGVTLWLPSTIRSLSGLSDFSIGAVATIPYVLTAIAMVLAGRHSDRAGERRWHTAMAAFLAAASLGMAASGRSVLVVVGGMSLGMMGAEAMVGPFWAMATAKMKGSSAAVAIAVINSLANLGGYFGPWILGLVRSANGGFAAGLLAIASVMLLSGLAALSVKNSSGQSVRI
ncbi:MAG: MFS transporter [Candidatus Sulfotelmatobacter sp.]